jgi:2,5-furandicarboxylate decarboxylase 1
MGIDATMPEGIPREYYERITYAYADRAKIGDYANGKSDEPGRAGDDLEVAALSEKVLHAIEAQPLYYTDIAERFSEYDFRTVARALGDLHVREKLWQDARGRMCVRGSRFAATPPRRA